MAKTTAKKRKARALKSNKKANGLKNPTRRRDTEWEKEAKGWQLVGTGEIVEGGTKDHPLKEYSIKEGPLADTIFYITPSLIPNQLSIQIYGESKWLGGAKVRCFEEIGLLRPRTKTITHELVGFIWDRGRRLYDISVHYHGKDRELIIMNGMYDDCSDRIVYFGEEPKRLSA